MQLADRNFIPRPLHLAVVAAALIGVLFYLLLLYSPFAMLSLGYDNDESPLSGLTMCSPILLIPLLFALTITFGSSTAHTSHLILISGSIGLGAFAGSLVGLLSSSPSAGLLLFLLLVVLLIACALMYAPQMALPSMMMLLSALIVVLNSVLVGPLPPWQLSWQLALSLLRSLLPLGFGLWVLAVSFTGMRMQKGFPLVIGASGIAMGSCLICFFLSGTFGMLAYLSGMSIVLMAQISSASFLIYVVVSPIWLIGVSVWLYQRQRSDRLRFTFQSI